MYHKNNSYDDNDSQSNNLLDPIYTNASKLMELPKLVKLSASGEMRSRCNRKIVLAYHTPNKDTNPEKYAHCLLILF